MRDRLIELLKDYGIRVNCSVLADRIIDDNWKRYPCNIGDVVYFAVDDYHDSAVIDGIHITEQGVLFTWVQYEVGYELTECWDEGEFYIDEIGKTVFLTKEEAEQALKGGEG